MATNLDEFQIEIKLTSAEAAKAIDLLVGNLEKLGKNVNMDKPAKELDKVSKSMKTLSNVSKKIAGLGAGLAILSKGISSSVKLATEYTQTLNMMKVVMGEGTKEAVEFANKLGDTLGINPADVMNFQVTFQNLMTGFGNTSEKAQIMSKNLTQLSYDMAAFYAQLGGDSQAAAEKLRLAMAGTIEPIQRLGYAIKEADLQAVAARQGLNVNIRNLDTASKSMLRYIAIMEQSTHVQGYMAKSFSSPATAMLVFKSTVKQLSTEVGKTFLPMLMAAIPYMQAFVRGVLNVVKAINGFFGIELPTINWEEAQNGLTNIGKEATDTGNAIKKAFTLGIDELNVFDSTTSGVGNSMQNITGLLDLPEYDMLEGFNGKEVDEITKKFEKIVGIVASIGAGILAWKVSSNLLDALSEITKMKKIENIKMAAKITMAVTGFALEFDAAKAIGKGEGDVSKYIQLAIGTAMGVAGSVMLIGGPLGWTIGITAALAIAVSGITVGFNQSVDEMIKEEFYDGGGTITITELSEDFAGVITEISKMNDAVIQSGEKIKEYGTKSKEASEDIEKIATALGNGYESANINIPKLQEKFQELATTTKTLMEETYDNIIMAVSGSLKQALIDAGVNVPQIVAEISKIKGESETTYNELMKEYDDISKKMQEGKGDVESYAEQLLNVATKMQELSGQADPVKEAFSDVDKALIDIDWQSEEAKNNAFEVLKNSTKGALENVEQFTNTLSENLKLLEQQGVSSDTISKITNAMIQVSEQQKSDIQSTALEYADIIQTSLVNGMEEQFEKSQQEYSNYNWGQKLISKLIYGSGEESFTRSTLQKYRDDYINPITTELQDIFDEVGIEGSTWASDASKEIIDSLFKTDIIHGEMGTNVYYEYQSSIEQEIEKALDGIKTKEVPKAKDAGKNVIEGMSQGITENSILLNDSIRNVLEGKGGSSTSLIQTTMDTLGIHSPSTVFADFGMNIDQGLANGITDNASTVTDSMQNLLNSMLEKTEGFIEKMRNAMNSFLKEFARSMASISIEDGDVSYSKIPKITIPRFESGGFPTSGEMFFAREDGLPEMVGRVGRQTAVMNNGQIADTMANSLIKAMNQGGASQQPTVIENKLYLDGEVVYNNQQKIQRSKGYNLGMGVFANV